MACADVGRQQLASVLDDRRAQSRALAEREPLPQRFEERVLLAEQPLQRLVKIVQTDPAPSARPDIVPCLVREALHVVGKISGELDDGLAEAFVRLDAGS